jgi:hypothetical protein
VLLARTPHETSIPRPRICGSRVCPVFNLT